MNTLARMSVKRELLERLRREEEAGEEETGDRREDLVDDPLIRRQPVARDERQIAAGQGDHHEERRVARLESEADRADDQDHHDDRERLRSAGVRRDRDLVCQLVADVRLNQRRKEQREQAELY